jgi:uncharacterized membrane protein
MMDPILAEWGSALLRWTHVVTGIAWIGSSFYFMHLDASLKPAPGVAKGRGGTAWEVHGGGFYEVKKYMEAPAHLPQDMTWHKWQAYSTWITGFFLLVWVYYAQSDLYLIDPAVRELSPVAASAIGMGGLVLGWLVYDGLCRSSLAKREVVLAASVFVFLVAITYVFQNLFSGRGALIHVGAVIATMMSGNVFFIIIPGQKKIIAALTSDQTPDPALGMRAKIRSMHNNYLTLPVVFLMLSGHYPLLYSTPYSHVIVALVLVAGALVRHFYNVRHAGGGDPWWTWALAIICLWLALWISSAASPLGRERLGLAPLPAIAAHGPLAPEAVSNIITGRCGMCHAREPSWFGIAIAPKGVLLDTPQAIARQKDAIRMHSVITHAMPPNNITLITPEERRVLAAWTGAR